MDPSGYVDVYRNLPVPLADGSATVVDIRNYLQFGVGNQSTRAQAKQSELALALARLLRWPGMPPATFELDDYTFVWSAVRRVFMGKGAPDEIQDTLWLASRCGLVDSGTIQDYCNQNLGVDCGGFVANFWGIGRPSVGNNLPFGWDGFKPRTIWDMGRAMRRRGLTSVAIGDAAIFFENVQSDNPDVSGSKAFHIGLVSWAGQLDLNGTIELWIAESSGAPRRSGANGASEREFGTVTLKQAQGLVYTVEGANRVYFVSPSSGPSPYLPYSLGAEA